MKKVFLISIFLLFTSSVQALSYVLVKNQSGEVQEKVFFDETKTSKILKINSLCYYQQTVNRNTCEFFYPEENTNSSGVTGSTVVSGGGTMITGASYNQEKPGTVGELAKSATFVQTKLPAKPAEKPVEINLEKTNTEKIKTNTLQQMKINEFVNAGKTSKSPALSKPVEKMFATSTKPIALVPLKKYIAKSRGHAVFFENTIATTTKHGLSYIPKKGDCFVYLLSRPEFNMGSVWVDSESETDIKLNILNPVATTSSGTSTLTVAWRCEK